MLLDLLLEFVEKLKIPQNLQNQNTDFDNSSFVKNIFELDFVILVHCAWAIDSFPIIFRTP